MSARELQPSMSRTDLLLECTYPFGQRVSTAASLDDSAGYGSCFHELMAETIDRKWDLPRGARYDRAAKDWNLSDAARTELESHLPEAARVLRTWLGGQNPFQVDFLRGGRVLTEQSYALRNDPPKGIRHYWRPMARVIAAPTKEEHVYEDLRPGELAGTADLVIVPAYRRTSVPLLVLDHKTSVVEDFYEPLKKAQLVSLARAATLAHGLPPAGVIVAVLHARRRGLSAVYADEAPKTLLEEHADRVFLQLARIGDGYMRPGPWCTTARCPAHDACPARDAQLLDKAGGLLESLVRATGSTGSELAPLPTSKLTPAQKLGALYAVVQQAEKLAEASRREIRTAVLAGALPELPSGGVLTVRPTGKENLSKASILRAYGKLAGEKLLAKLRTAGAIETIEGLQLHVEKERGE